MAKESLGKKIKKGVYGVVAEVDKKLDEKDGLAGKVADFVGDTVKTVEQMREDIKKSGGYKAAAKRTGKVIADSFKENVSDRVKKIYRSIENDLFTNGELDPEKVKARLKNETKAVEKYGRKAYKRLSELASQGTEAVKRDYHEFIPTDDSLKTKYAGIGIKYRGALFIEDYENCLAFRRKVQRKLPTSIELKAQILEDIKASASGSKEDLIKFYAWQVTQEEDGKSAPDKIKVIDNYLKQKPKKSK